MRAEENTVLLTMDLDSLPNEIITHIFTILPTIDSVLALASTSKHFNEVYHGSQRLTILSSVADTEFGPLDDILQICTYNASQPAHLHREAPISDALMAQVLKIGRVAKQWEDVYPFKKWKSTFASSRRLLTPSERYTLRRAIYRLWLYTKAFYNRTNPRTMRNNPQTTAERAALLHNWTTPELSEMLDVQIMLRDVIANNICPSNGRIRQKFNKRFPESNHQLLFNIHLNYPPPAPSWCNTASDGWINNSILTSSKYTSPNSRPSRLQPSRFHEPGAEGWGDDISHYYVVEDMMKLDPQQILFLRDRCPLKIHVETYLKMQVDGYAVLGGGDGWFNNNGETFSETLWFVVRQRGGDVEALKAAVEEGEMGVAVDGV
jgi:hypothetical protein